MISDYQILTQNSNPQIDFSDFEILGKIEYVSEGVTTDQQFPQFAGGAVNSYVLATNNQSYTLLLHLNFVTSNLFFSVIDTSGEYVIKYRKLAELPTEADLKYPTNLLGSVLIDCELYFSNWALYFRAGG